MLHTDVCCMYKRIDLRCRCVDMYFGVDFMLQAFGKRHLR